MKKWLVLMAAILMCTGCSVSTSGADLTEESLKELPKCFIAASYHVGYEGQDNVVEGIMNVLQDKMEIRLFSMNTKNYPSVEYAQEKAADAWKIIQDWQPDVIIALDDNVSKYLVVPYLKDSDFNVVFAGVNWTAEEYGYPYPNVTGMLEVHPIQQAIEQINRLYPAEKTCSIIYPQTESDEKHYQRFQEVLQDNNTEITAYPVTDFSQFKEAYTKSQDSDFVIFVNQVGITGWDNAEAAVFLKENTKKLSLSTNPWMTEFVVMTFAMNSQEQGEYAGELALEIAVNNKTPSDYPIVSNRQWLLTINITLLDLVDIDIPDDLYNKAVKEELE